MHPLDLMADELPQLCASLPFQLARAGLGLGLRLKLRRILSSALALALAPDQARLPARLPLPPTRGQPTEQADRGECIVSA